MTSANQPENQSQQSAPGIGGDLRALRKSHNLTLSELALKIGRSVGFLSQVERGLSSPSIEDLRAISAAFDVPIGWFFVNESIDETERGIIVRAGGRRKVGAKEAGLVEELLSPDLGGAFEMFLSVFEPGAGIEHEVSRDTEEAGFVVSGALDLWINGQFFHLQAGDSFRLDHKPYRWRNAGDEAATVVWVVSPPIY